MLPLSIHWCFRGKISVTFSPELILLAECILSRKAFRTGELTVSNAPDGPHPQPLSQYWARGARSFTQEVYSELFSLVCLSICRVECAVNTAVLQTNITVI